MEKLIEEKRQKLCEENAKDAIKVRMQFEEILEAAMMKRNYELVKDTMKDNKDKISNF